MTRLLLALVALSLPAHAGQRRLTWYRQTAHRTASGEPYAARPLACADRATPLGTDLVLSHEGHVVRVRVNDRPAARIGAIDCHPAVWDALRIPLREGRAMIEVAEAPTKERK